MTIITKGMGAIIKKIRVLSKNNLQIIEEESPVSELIED